MPLRYLLSSFLLFSSISHADDEAVDYQRLGWMNKNDIKKLAAEQQPSINKACQGAWVTPIAATSKNTTVSFNNSPIEALAAWVYYNPEGSSRLNGNVKISQEGRVILADNAELAGDRSNGQFTGNILLAEAGTVLTGDKARLDFANKTGHKVKIIRMTKEYGTIHAVPAETMQKMRDRFEKIDGEEEV